MTAPPTWASLLAARAPEDPAVVSLEGVWTTGELLARAGGAADWLDAVGAPAGVPVAALLTTTPSAVALTVGAMASGRPLAPLGPRLTHHELGACVAALGSTLVVAEPTQAAVAASVAAATGARVAVLEDPPAADRDLLAGVGPESVAVILHTSGTTGNPRAVPCRQDRLAVRTRLHAGLLALGPDTRYATASPFHHVAGLGMVLAALGAGAAVLTLDRFSVAGWAELVERGMTHALLVPTMIDQLLAEGALRTASAGSLCNLHYGAAPIHPATLHELLAAVPAVDLVQVYGQTEGSPLTCLSAADHRRAAGEDPALLMSVGRAVPGAEVRVVDADAAGIGEVLARAPHLFSPGPDGWLHTGDLGRLDRGGYLHLAGRRADMIIRGGENVYPEEVERVLRTHPAVQEAAVVGVADRRLGELVKAVVVPADPDRPPRFEELARFARERLAGFKVPSEWVLATELPRNSAGKVLRRALTDGGG